MTQKTYSKSKLITTHAGGHFGDRKLVTSSKEAPLYPAGVEMNEDSPLLTDDAGKVITDDSGVILNVSLKEEPLYPPGQQINANTMDEDDKLYPAGVVMGEATTEPLPRPDRDALRVMILEQLENRGGLQHTCQLLELAEIYFIYKLTNDMNFVEESFRVPYSWTANGLVIHWSREAPLTAPAILEPVERIEANRPKVDEEPLMPIIYDEAEEKKHYINKFKEDK